jgi:hypothetical protein
MGIHSRKGVSIDSIEKPVRTLISHINSAGRGARRQFAPSPAGGLPQCGCRFGNGGENQRLDFGFVQSTR